MPPHPDLRSWIALLLVGLGWATGTAPTWASTGPARADPDPVHGTITRTGVEAESGQAVQASLGDRNEGSSGHASTPASRHEDTVDLEVPRAPNGSPAPSSAAESPSDEPTLTLAPPAGTVTAGTVLAVGVFFHNPGTLARHFTAPQRLAVKLVTSRSTIETELVLGQATGTTFDLPAGGSARVEYGLKLPEELAGPVGIAPARAGAPTALIHVERAPQDAGENANAGADEAPVANDPNALPLPPPLSISEHANQRFSTHEPNYFLGGDRPTARFQFSFKYQVFDPESEFAAEHPWIGSMRIGYSQTSLWDVGGKSKPFTDSSYRPEIFWSRDRLDWVKLPWVTQLGLETGLQHESNGRDGADSRSLNVFYVRPVLLLGEPERFHWRVMPKFVAYLFDQEDNPDIERYRGWCDLRVAAGRIDALEIAAQVRVGSGMDRGSLQLDATYPLKSISDAYLQMQYFNGYGESLLRYDERSESLRIGIALSR